MNPSLFDKVLIFLAVYFSLLLGASYWFPGGNDKAFTIISFAVTNFISFLLGKYTNSEA